MYQRYSNISLDLKHGRDLITNNLLLQTLIAATEKMAMKDIINGKRDK
jgi:hypothetical protein